MSRAYKIEVMCFSMAVLVSLFVVECASAPPTSAKTPVPEILVANEPAAVSCLDGDRDGVCDADDRCPMK